jgi:hypothetical protein
MSSRAPNPKKRDFSAYDKKPYNKEGGGGGRSYGNNNNGGGGGGNYGKSYGNNNGKSYGNNNGGGKSYGNNNGGGDWKGKGKFTPKPKTEKDEPRRKRPITSGGGDEPLDYDEVQAEEYGEGDVDMDASGGGEGPAEKKPRMSKAEKAALHASQPHRTTLLPSHPLLQDTLLPLWETARRTDTPKDERTKAVKELYGAVKGRILEISKGHKGGRVLQTVGRLNIVL